MSFPSVLHLERWFISDHPSRNHEGTLIYSSGLILLYHDNEGPPTLTEPEQPRYRHDLNHVTEYWYSRHLLHTLHRTREYCTYRSDIIPTRPPVERSDALAYHPCRRHIRLRAYWKQRGAGPDGGSGDRPVNLRRLARRLVKYEEGEFGPSDRSTNDKLVKK